MSQSQSFPMQLLRKSGMLVDVDGTLTNRRREITPRTIQALAAAAAAQFPIGLCTGRQVAQLHHYVLSRFPSQALHVVGGGGQVARSSGEVVWSQEIPSEVVRELCVTAQTLGCGFGFGVDKIFYANAPLLKRFEADAWHVTARQPDGLTNWQTPLVVINQLNPAMETYLDSLREIAIKRMVDVTGAVYVDITATGVTKALGVRMWAQLQGLDVSEIIGVGDGANDLEFLQQVGWGVAMTNAVAPLKAVADQIIGDIDADGLAIFIEAFLLKREALHGQGSVPSHR